MSDRETQVITADDVGSVPAELTTIQPRQAMPALATATNEELPEFMRGETQGDNGLSLLAQYVTPPFLKVVQKQASDSLLAMFAIGDVIMSPQNAMVASIMRDPVTEKPTMQGTPFYFVPLFFYPEFIVINPYELKGQLQFIRERSLDPKSKIAATARNFQASRQPCPESPQHYIRYCECMNFIVALVDHQLAAIPAMLSFSRGSFKYGQAFSTALNMRLRGGGKMWGTQFQGATVPCKNDKGQEWRAIAVSNPAGDSGVAPWVQDKEWYEWYTYQAGEFARLHSEGLLQADYEDDNNPIDPAAQSAVPANAPQF